MSAVKILKPWQPSWYSRSSVLCGCDSRDSESVQISELGGNYLPFREGKSQGLMNLREKATNHKSPEGNCRQIYCKHYTSISYNKVKNSLVQSLSSDSYHYIKFLVNMLLYVSDWLQPQMSTNALIGWQRNSPCSQEYVSQVKKQKSRLNLFFGISFHQLLTEILWLPCGHSIDSRATQVGTFEVSVAAHIALRMLSAITPARYLHVNEQKQPINTLYWLVRHYSSKILA